MRTDGFGEVVEATVLDGGAITEPRQRGAGRVHGIGIAVEAEEPDLRCGIEERRGVAAATDGRVDDQPRRDDREELDHTVPEDWFVSERRHRIVTTHSPRSLTVAAARRATSGSTVFT